MGFLKVKMGEILYPKVCVHSAFWNADFLKKLALTWRSRTPSF